MLIFFHYIQIKNDSKTDGNSMHDVDGVEDNH